MARKNISLLSQRELAITVLSKLLYHMATRFPHMEEIVFHHRNLLKNYINKEIGLSDISNNPSFSIHEIPWESILDTITTQSVFLKKQQQKYNLTSHEIRYMCAMLCGLSGKEYGLITGFKSHYNLSWSIRHKFELPTKSTNLRIFLKKLSENEIYESMSINAPK